MPESGIVVLRKSVNQVKPVNDPFTCEKVDFFGEDVKIEWSMDRLENRRMDRLQTKLHRTVEFTQQARSMSIDKINLGFKVIVKVGSLVQQHFEQGNPALRGIVERRIENPYLTDPRPFKEFQLLLQALPVNGADPGLATTFETVIAGKGTSSGDLPENAA